MAQTRLYLPLPLAEGESIDLPNDSVHYLLKVLRVQRGTTVTLFNGEGGEYEAELVSASKKSATLLVQRYIERTPESPLDITLFQALAKGERMDYSVQKAVELGVTAIQPITSERTMVQTTNDRWSKRARHYAGVIQSACEQSGRTRLPEFLPLLTLNEALISDQSDLRLILSPYAQANILSLASHSAPSTISVYIGPEGGFSDGEIEQALRNGLTDIQLGPRVLRTETAGSAIISLLQARWGDWV